MRHKSNRGKEFTTQLLEKFIISRPQGASVRGMAAWHYVMDGSVDCPYLIQNQQYKFILSGSVRQTNKAVGLAILA